MSWGGGNACSVLSLCARTRLLVVSSPFVGVVVALVCWWCRRPRLFGGFVVPVYSVVSSSPFVGDVVRPPCRANLKAPSFHRGAKKWHLMGNEQTHKLHSYEIPRRPSLSTAPLRVTKSLALLGLAPTDKTRHIIVSRAGRSLLGVLSPVFQPLRLRTLQDEKIECPPAEPLPAKSSRPRRAVAPRYPSSD